MSDALRDANGGSAQGFALLEARHVDNLVESIRALNRNLVKLDETIQKQTAAMLENQRVTTFDTATMKRIEDNEVGLAELRESFTVPGKVTPRTAKPRRK